MYISTSEKESDEYKKTKPEIQTHPADQGAIHELFDACHFVFTYNLFSFYNNLYK